jgi:hypothetical protein
MLSRGLSTPPADFSVDRHHHVVRPLRRRREAPQHTAGSPENELTQIRPEEMPSPMKPLGTILRLQVQQSSLKVGPLQGRSYDPSPLRTVPAITLTDAGVTGIEASGASVPDVHHRDHPAGKHHGDNGVSILFTQHYRVMRERFGAHLTDGIAGESILVETEEPVRPEDVDRGITIRTVGGREALLEEVRVAEPCVEFTRFTIHYPADSRSDPQVTDALEFLREGMRGFYASYHGEPVTVGLGDSVFLGAG